MKRPSAQEMTLMKEDLYLGLAKGELSIREATLKMRKILGMTQKEYAKKIAGVSPRILSAFETGTGNPTLATLEKIAAPFGLEVTFLPPESWRIHPPNTK
ncbi:MAG: XRE family transcriptional regulator [Desulfuromonas sp.]|nr:MAG: XRE family transcriptional regulator [Desulfuromonas sp.]